MDGAPTAACASQDHRTLAWARRSVLRAGTGALSSTAVGAWAWTQAARWAGTAVGVAYGLAAGAVTLVALGSWWSLLVWRWRWRALRGAPWRLGAVTITQSVSRGGHRRVDADVAYPGGGVVRYRLGDSTSWWTSDALARSVEVWVASGPDGTVIATPGPGRCALAGPGGSPEG